MRRSARGIDDIKNIPELEAQLVVINTPTMRGTHCIEDAKY